MSAAEAGAGDRIRLVGEFVDPQLEDAYRRRHAPFDRFLGRAIIASAAVAVVALAALDYHFLSHGPELAGLWAMRAVFFVLSAVALYRLRGDPSPAAFERCLGAWYGLTVVLHVHVGAVWPAGHIEMRMTTALAVLMSYCVMPLPLRAQTAGALLYTGGALLVAGWLNPAGDSWAVVGEVTWLALINVIGVFLSHRLHARQRMLFAALLRQSELSSSLGKALAEVRTLRGLLRVCAWCRKVDTGADWQQLEKYVKEHSHAEFTHGICPVCLDAASAEVAAVAPVPEARAARP